MLADLQTAGVGDHERRAIEAVIASDPDIVLIPGDLFQGTDDEFDGEVAELQRLLRDLDAPSGVYLTRGDIDGGDRADRAIAGSGITILDDRVVQVGVRGTTVWIGGTRLDYASESADVVRQQLDDGADRRHHAPGVPPSGHRAGALPRCRCRPHRRGSHPWRPGVATRCRSVDDALRCPPRRRRRRSAHDQRQPDLRVSRHRTRARSGSPVEVPRPSDRGRPRPPGMDRSTAAGGSACVMTAGTRENRDPMTPDVQPVKIGPIAVWPPVVLAPMAGVTDAPFRVLCSEFGRGLYVNQMVTARALAREPSDLVGPDPVPPARAVRSLQLYGTDPTTLADAVRRVAGRGPRRPHRHELRLPRRRR